MRPIRLVIYWLGLGLILSGCTAYNRQGMDPQALLHRKFKPFPETRQRILALDPEHVSEKDIRELLAQAPAPRIINIHGGVYPVYLRMISFSEFLIGMGYPAASITNPGNGRYTFSCYESSDTIAGMIAWYYEKEGLRPMIVGHSQGGMQAMKVLRDLAGLRSGRLAVWNPLTGQKEKRFEIIDPLTGQNRPVVGLQLPYASAVGAGGLTRLLPNQWDLFTTLRRVPDSVEEFTGFYKGRDLLGGDFLGYGSANHFKANGTAAVRNVCLPSSYSHVSIPNTKHLLKSQAMMDWINNYRPPDVPLNTPTLDVKFDGDSSNILWAADVWYSIKKHWVLELQRLLSAEHSLDHGG